MKKKSLVFDMDGTIVDLYGVTHWLEMIEAEKVTPYQIAKPIHNIDIIDTILNIFKDVGYSIIVTTWLSKCGTPAYNEKVSQAKKEWLNKYNFPYDNIHIVEYGTNKSSCSREEGGYQILIDDNEEVRREWDLGDTINPQENLIEKLIDLLLKELE